jgi:hypothetical protein
MTAISRRSATAPVSQMAVLAAPDDLNGVQDNTKSYDITGASRVLVLQVDNGTTGTAGIDAISISHDGGTSWVKDSTTVLLESSDDATGTLVADGVLNAAGIEPTGGTAAKLAVFKCGPYEGPTAIRIFRYVTDRADTAAWVTGAPGVYLITVGQKAGALTALA